MGSPRRASLLGALALVLLGLSAGACGGTSNNAASASEAASRRADRRRAAHPSGEAIYARTWREQDRDKDNDFSAAADDTNHYSTFHFGHEASPSDRRAIEALVRRYYAAALAGDGKAACSLLYSTFAEAVPEDYGSYSFGEIYTRGKTCPEVLTKLFGYRHAPLSTEVPRLRVVAVRLQHAYGMVVLGFRGLPDRQIPVQRERRTWKIEALLDGELP
jgi:hypothetical protein